MTRGTMHNITTNESQQTISDRAVIERVAITQLDWTVMNVVDEQNEAKDWFEMVVKSF